MNAQRLGTIVRLELTQRTRSVAWYVLLGVFAVLLVIVTSLSFMAFSWSGQERGSAIYSTIVYITLLLVVLVSPTLSGNSINGDRDAATLAPVQVTLATTADILIGKFLAAYQERRILERDPFASLDTVGVGQLVEMGTKKGRSTRPKLKVGVCGEHGGDPSSIFFFDKVGLDYVSCSPYRVPVARLAAAQAALKQKALD